MEKAKKALLANRDLRLEYGFGRDHDLATKLGLLLPHIQLGAAGLRLVAPQKDG